MTYHLLRWGSSPDVRHDKVPEQQILTTGRRSLSYLPDLYVSFVKILLELSQKVSSAVLNAPVHLVGYPLK
jgi:hypothetical protein